MTRVIGWDVGGANVKAALVDGASIRAVTHPIAIWRDPHALPRTLAGVAHELGRADAMAVTMTAELADCFATRAEGVAFVLDALAATFPVERLHVFDHAGGFRSPADARADPGGVASANWAATARWLARGERDALLIDVGTTTTDVIPLVGGEVAAVGRTDAERLASGELVYTGAVRTPCCAVARSVRVAGTRYRVAAELFAQMGDVYTWLGRLREAEYLGETPDGRGKSRAEAGARLARMIAAEPAGLGDEGITQIAQDFARHQERQIAAAIREVLAGLGRRAPKRAIVAGLGAFLGLTAAARAGLDARDVAERLGREVSAAAPAVAVATLFLETRP